MTTKIADSMNRFLILLFSALPFVTSAQDNAITGRLIDSGTKSAIANAVVKKGSTTTQTNHLGYFQLNAVAGDTLVVTHAEYGELVLLVPAQTRFALALDKIDNTGKVKPEPAAGLGKLLSGNNQVYAADQVDQKPTPLMGEDKFIEQWNKLVEYPKDAKRNKAEGTVEIYFVVDQSGKVVDSGVEKGIGKGFDGAALKAFRRTKAEWKPGILNGEAVNVRMTMPYRFKLS
jgi:TonB family protein